MRTQFLISTILVCHVGLCASIAFSAPPAGNASNNVSKAESGKSSAEPGPYYPATWPVFLYPDKKYNDPAILANFITEFSAKVPARAIAFMLTDPPSAAAVSKRLPFSKTEGPNRIVLAKGTVVTLVRVNPDDTKEKVFRKAFAQAVVTREQLASVLKNLPASATVSVEPPDGSRVSIRGDIPRALKAVRTAPSGTMFSAKWGKRSVRYPRLK